MNRCSGGNLPSKEVAKFTDGLGPVYCTAYSSSESLSIYQLHKFPVSIGTLSGIESNPLRQFLLVTQTHRVWLCAALNWILQSVFSFWFIVGDWGIIFRPGDFDAWFLNIPETTQPARFFERRVPTLIRPVGSVLPSDNPTGPGFGRTLAIGDRSGAISSQTRFGRS
jgi:hypothetical protein